MDDTENKGRDQLPYPAQDAEPSSGYAQETTMSLVAQAGAVAVSVPSAGTKQRNPFPDTRAPHGVWVDVEELRKLHPRASWLLDGAGITE